jgi:Glycosyl hydrolase catalytic core
MPRGRRLGSTRVTLAAAAIAVGCLVAGGIAVIHLNRTGPVAAAGRAATASPGTPAPGSRNLASPSPPPVRTAAPHPSASAATHQPVPSAVPPAVTSSKKGVGAWGFTGASQALAESGASWYYTWSASPGVSGPAGVQFVPMIWGAADVTASTLAQVKQEGDDLLGFNEPDMSSQSNMTPAQALSLWPQLMATGMQLGSPAVADDGATPGGWLDQFMSGAAAHGYRVSFITLHWYGSDFATAAAVSQLESYLQAVYARYHLPIWLTEFALANFGGSPATPTPRQQAAFVKAATAMLQGLSFVQRYAWFGLEATSTDGSMGLFRSGAVPTAAGRAFEAAG